MSMMLAMLGSATNTPRLGACVSKPSLVSMRKASRKVLRETFRRSHSADSDKRCPGSNAPRVNSVRRDSATWLARLGAGRTFILGMAGLSR